MKAWVLHKIGDFRLEEVDRPVLKEDEVLVQVQAAGVCGSDISRIYRTGTYSYPLIPGHEFSGTVVELGENVKRGWKNKRVGVFPLIPCHECGPCQKGKYEMCRHYSYLGSRTAGGFAEYVAVPERNLIELSDSVSYEEAAMLEPMAVAVHAMRSMHPGKEKCVAVCGLGTIGMLLVMFLLDAGIKNLYVIGNKDFQKKKTLELGIPETSYCDSHKENPKDWLLSKTNGNGVDVYFECVGKNETVEQGICVTAPGGRIQLVGNPASEMKFDRDIYWKILRNQLTVKGSWNSSFTHSVQDDWHYVLSRLEEKRIHPQNYITQKFSFEELDKGLLIMRDKTEEYLKIMIERSV